MTALCGAWVLSGAPAESALDAGARRAMLAACGRGLREVLDGPLWLASAPADHALLERRHLAYTGFLVDAQAPGGLERLLARPGLLESVPPRGHYALALADMKRQELTLYLDLFGAARLYYAVEGGLLLFSTHAKALLRGGVAAGGLDRETGVESVLSSDNGVIFGSRSLLAGISELPPGEMMRAAGGRISFEPKPNPFVRLGEPGEPRAPKRLRADMLEAAALAVGAQKRIAVALSGGMDSAVVAALAVELLGARGVEAFTYEFEDPSHPSETAYAAAVCRRLGIRHHIVTVSYRQYVEALPELFWRLEAPRLAPGAWVRVGRALRDNGFERILTGDGMELALGIPMYTDPLEAVAGALSWIPRPGTTLRYWKARRFHGWPLRRLARLLHPGLEPPHPHFYHMLLCVLRHNGLIDDVAPFYPGSLARLASGSAESARVRDAVAARGALPLPEQLRHHRLHSYILHRLMRSKQAAYREMGALPIYPAFFLNGAPLRAAAGTLGARALQRAAFREDVPDEVLERPKIENQSILSRQWASKITASMMPLAAEAAARLAPADARADLGRHYGRELALLGFWMRIFDAGPVAPEPPTLKSLGLEGLFAK